jgi:aminoglycoside 6'-N-acetyltransferase I
MGATNVPKPDAITIVDLPDDERLIHAVAQVLIDGFITQAPDAWPDRDSALEEVRESLQPDRCSRIALDAAGAVVGWIGGQPQYNGKVWELHPLVVRADRRGLGIGRALVEDLEARVRERGGITLWLGTDDETGQTSLSGIDLYPDVLHHAATIRNQRGHPFGFYQKLGFVIVGLLPDANGFGKPDIWMAKRVGDMEAARGRR